MSRSIPLFVLTTAFAAGALAAAPSKVFHRTVPLASGGRVELQSARGADHITTWDRNEVDILARIEADPESREPAESVRRTTIQLSVVNDSVLIATDFHRESSPRFGDSWDPLPHVSYEIHVPRSVILHVRDDRSEIKLDHLSGQLLLDTDRSLVNVVSLTGTLDVQADRGQIVIGRLDLTGSSRLQTDRTALELGLASSQRLQLDLDLERVTPSVEAGLFPGVIHEDHHRTTYRGTADREVPTLHIAADRGSLWLHRAPHSS